jgi:hypothetical protein
MQRLIPLVLAGGAFAAALALTAVCVDSRRSPGGGTDAGVVARSAIQALIDGDGSTFEKFVGTRGTGNVRGQTSLLTFGFSGCQIADVQLPGDVTREPVLVVFQTPCGQVTRAIGLISVWLELRNGRFYVSSIT